MKILFIYKYAYFEPLGIPYLSAVLRKYGHETFFIDLQFTKNYVKEIKEIVPDVIAYSITTGKHNLFRELNLELKKKFNYFAVFGGPHCTFFPDFINENGVDAICKGESEYAFAELINKLENKEDIRFIKNVDVKVENNIYKNEVRNLIQDLDEIPFPDRELIYRYNHYRKSHRKTVMTSRGCPYKCSYCFNHSYNRLYAGKGNMIRQRSVDNVIAELKELKLKYNPKIFQFNDDTFILSKKWTMDFCERYKKEINLTFNCILRVNLMDEEIIKALKNAGCDTVTFGIESGSDHLRNDILKRDITRKQITDAAKICHKYKIKIISQNMVGLPDESFEDALETVKLNIECKPKLSWVSIFQPYPNTDLSNYSVKKGYFNLHELDSINVNFHKNSVLRTKDIKRIERLHHFFYLAVDFPFLIPLIKLLTKVPLNNIYYTFWSLYRGAGYYFRLRWFDVSELFLRK